MNSKQVVTSPISDSESEEEPSDTESLEDFIVDDDSEDEWVKARRIKER
jgi:hypothetical protein